MEIKGKAHCLFEQSGTFKREFIKLGIPAEDYDIQNNFGETDHQIDLFAEIERAYEGGESIFDSMSCDDIIMAFFPCIEFSCVAQFWYSLNQKNIREWKDDKSKFDFMLEKNSRRAYMFGLLYKLCAIAIMRGLRLVFENPWAMNTYLKQNVFLKEPSVIDNDRTRRGDYYTKPTAYWYFNCEPTQGASYQKPKELRKGIIHCKPSGKKGLCSEERSMISPDYARNFICDFIIGKEQVGSQLNLFPL